jgi:hypothetical protein
VKILPVKVKKEKREFVINKVSGCPFSRQGI